MIVTKMEATALFGAWALSGALFLASSLVPDPWSFAVAMYGGVPVLLAWLALTAWSIAVLSRCGRGALALACVIMPVAIPVGAWYAIPWVNYRFDYAHFHRLRPRYDASVARLHQNGHRFAEFNWGGLMFASRGIVYDETDEVGLRYGRQSAAWKKRMRDSDLTCGGNGPVGEVISLGDHYYIATFGC